MSPWRDSLECRAALLRKARRFFDDRGFLEVTPPCLLNECILDRHIDPIRVTPDQLHLAPSAAGQAAADDCSPAEDLDPRSARARWGVDQYLQTSPELAMKRMLAGGSGSIYSIGPVFRGGEVGALHRPEFWMLEWYQVGADYDAGLQTLAEFSQTMLDTPSCHLLSYRDAFRNALDLDPISSPIDALNSAIGDPSLADSIGPDRDSILDVLLTESVQPTFQLPTVLYDYPYSQAALAKRSSKDAQCAARYEWFAAGIELGNGYDELRDPDELDRRMTEISEDRLRRGRPKVPKPASLSRAMRKGLPPSCGVAVGIDRLQMVVAGQQRLVETMPTDDR